MSDPLTATTPCSLTAHSSTGIGGSVQVPGDKSVSHRALILGALAEGETSISGLLEGEDVMRTAAAVQAFGAEADRLGPGEWRVRGCQWTSPQNPIDCGNAGTAARLLMGAAAGYELEAVFVGDESLSARPMERVLGPLRTMGAETSGETLPVRIRGGKLGGISFVNERASAQVKSAILLAGLRSEGEVEVIEPVSSRDHTERMLRAFGCDVLQDGSAIRLGQNRSLRGRDVAVPGDPSSAAFPVVAGLISPASQVKIRSVLVNPLRIGLFQTLSDMGADLKIERKARDGIEPVADVTARTSQLKGIEVPAERAPSMIDEYPVLAVAAAFAEGRTIMHCLSELRVKESDRLQAIVSGLRECGVEAWAEQDTLIVEGCSGPPPGGGRVSAHGDHRIAMSFLILGLAAREPVSVDSANMIGTSFPGFAELMRSIGADIR